MNKKTTPKATKAAPKSSSEAGQGRVPIADAKNNDEPHRAFSASIEQSIIDAQEGDPKAWAVLYAAAATYVAGGVAVPIGLRELMAQRLQALSNALYATKDKRASLIDAASPMPKGSKRAKGAKPKQFTIEDAALDVLRYQAYHGVSLGEAARKMELILDENQFLEEKEKPDEQDKKKPTYLAASLEVAARRIKNSKQTPKNNT